MKKQNLYVRIVVNCAVGFLVGYLIGVIILDYQSRINYINHYTCATWGYLDDCKTPLPIEKHLK